MKMRLVTLVLLLCFSGIAYAQTPKNNAKKKGSTKVSIKNCRVNMRSHPSNMVRYIVDDVELSEKEFQALNLLRDTIQIENLTILKDASAEIYSGVRPSILIFTLKPTYQIQVFASGYDSFISTQPPKDFYTHETLRNKNILLVNEWNSRCENPLQNNTSLYSSIISYDPKQNYGLEVEYRLYMFFKYMEKENKIALL